MELALHQLSAFPSPVRKLLARLGHHVDRSLPGRFRGRISRLLGPQPGRFVSPDLATRPALIEALSRKGIRYAVIGSASPAIPGLDAPLTIMVDDEDANAARRFISPWPAGEEVEAFSPSGLPGFAYGDMPLMPPRLARRLLDGALPQNGIPTADSRDRFFANLFRLVYLTPPASGDQHGVRPLDGASEAALRHWADEQQLTLPSPITLASLDQFLAVHDWQPPLDMLERIGCWNPWIAEKLRKAGEWVGSEPPGLTVFYVRQRTLDEGKEDLVAQTLRRSGFQLFDLPQPSATQMASVAAEVRGGNWGRGPFPLSGGIPGRIIVAHDPAPIAPDAATLKQFPLLDNNRIQLAKQAVREAVHAGLARNKRYNAMHSTDNAVQAWRAVGELYPEREADLRAASHAR